MPDSQRRYARLISHLGVLVALALTMAIPAAAQPGGELVAKYRFVDAEIAKAERFHDRLMERWSKARFEGESAEKLLRKRLESSKSELEDLYRGREKLISSLIGGLNSRSQATVAETAALTLLHELRQRRPRLRGKPLDGNACKDADENKDGGSGGPLAKALEALHRGEVNIYASSLASWVRSFECRSMAESLRFNRRLAEAYRATLSRFGHNKALFTNARTSLLASWANIFIITLDHTKAAGPTPLFELLQDERDRLAALFANPSGPFQSAGYWLYDPAANRLVAVGPLCEGVAANRPRTACVAGAASLDALLDPWRLGLASCALVDMLSPSFDPDLGYLCQRDLCQDRGESMPLVDAMEKTGETLYDVSIGELRDARCAEGSGASSGGALVGVLSRLDEIGRCVTEALLEQRTSSEVQCVAAIARQGKSTFFGAPAPEESCGDPLAQDTEDRAARIAKLEWGRDIARDRLEDWQIQAAKYAFDSFDISDNPPCGANICGDVESRTIIFRGSFVDASNVQEIGDALVDFMNERFPPDTAPPEPEPLEPDDPDADPADENDELCWFVPCGSGYCHPDVGDCGDCSPGASMRAALLECSSEPGTQQVPQIGLPELIEPVPWTDPNDAAWAACIKEVQEIEDSSVACASNVDCGEGQLPTRQDDGTCTCAEAGSRIRPAPCAEDPIDCGDGRHPVVGPGGACLCGTFGADAYSPHAAK